MTRRKRYSVYLIAIAGLVPALTGCGQEKPIGKADYKPFFAPGAPKPIAGQQPPVPAAGIPRQLPQGAPGTGQAMPGAQAGDKNGTQPPQGAPGS
jgi:hypothetical protein